MWLLLTSSRPCSSCWPAGRRPVHVEDLAPWAAGAARDARWQSRHHSMVIGSSFHVSGIWSTRPWQRHAADPLLDVDRRGGSRRSRAGRGPGSRPSGLFSARLVRTGSSIGLSAQICEWQVMHVSVGGMPGERRGLDRRVAVAAVDPQARARGARARTAPAAGGRRRPASGRESGGTGRSGPAARAGPPTDAEDRQPRQGVGTRVEDLRHRSLRMGRSFDAPDGRLIEAEESLHTTLARIVPVSTSRALKILLTLELPNRCSRHEHEIPANSRDPLRQRPVAI